jgi:nitrite reductase/ring-hydroxylating ferredoxin subunit/uncharacterized membrane protein
METLTREQSAVLDSYADRLQPLLHTLVEQGGPAAQRAKNWLNGTWLGHPLHPALTDVPIGAWTTGAILDMVGSVEAADAAFTVGVLSAVPTALAGAADWSDTEGEPRRLGLLHALLNSAGLMLIVGSLFARRNNRRALGIALSTLGLSLSGVSAWIGGHLVYVLGTSIGRTAFEPPVADYTVVARADAVEDGKLFGADLDVDGVKIPLVLVKRGSTVMAIDGTCTHWGEKLSNGKLVEDNCVECPWHGSRFNMVDGRVRQGPATVPAHVFEARIREGNIEVRRPE